MSEHAAAAPTPTSALSTSAQNYLKAVWALQEWEPAPVPPSVLAQRLGLRPSTVSEGIRKLADQGLLEHTPYGSVTLTDEGRTHAVQMVRRHRLIETFLVRALGYGWDQVHDEAEHLEHAVSDFLIDRIDAYLGHPTRDPHGDPIPDMTGAIVVPNAVPLHGLPPGTRVRVERISDDDPELLQYLDQQRIGIGTELRIEAGPPYSDALNALTDDGTVTTLGPAALSEIWGSVQTEPSGDTPAA